MKLIVCLMGLGALLALTGCETEHHYRGHYRGAAYDEGYRSYGRDTYRYDRDRDWDRRSWEHRDWRYQ